jgi:selenocysteine-specific elongation factor
MLAVEWTRLLQSVRRYCEAEWQKRRPQRWMPRVQIWQHHEKRYARQVTDGAIDALVQQGGLQVRGTAIALAEQARLPPKQQALLDQLATEICSGGATPPLQKELAQQHQTTERNISLLVDLLVDAGHLVRVTDELALEPAALQQLEVSLRELLSKQPTVTVAQCRDLWQVTRKHALPYLQFFDERKVTERSGSLRVPGPAYQQSDLINTSS